ncbi:helix-turn-helix transcriptional regulator [Amycolatopsis keratiniphila subsp. nogabecina]|nr:helix-turn-helix transcriptional regulator [Amycolatopsis keratiniphila subsp. nogabecina]SDU66721.1 LuxR family transcriptional regulator, maltose regulon positive regulatory protein [Amycolatopsis keratiniphila]
MRPVVTKLMMPVARTGQVVRERLTALLDDALTRPLTLVTAPAGFGKTTLAGTWAHGLAAPTAWISLEPEDDVPGRLLEYTLAALRGAGVTAAEAARDLLESGGQSPTVLAVLTTLINDLATVRSPIVLVVDDFHVITQPEILDATAFLVEHCPECLHVVLLCRHEPALPLARWRAGGMLAEIGVNQLRFSAEEAAALLNSVTGSAVDQGSSEALHKRSEGWAAGLQLLGIGLRNGTANSAPSVRYGSGDRYVLDYLADEVLRDQPPELRSFLRLTSVLDTLTPPLCDAVTGRTDSARTIRDLERANLFLTPVDGTGEWYRYHRLFADYLRSELAPDEARDAHRRAAAWNAEHGSPEDTVKHALAGGDTTLAAYTVRKAAEDQVRRGELASLLGWLHRLPEQEIRTHADLAGFKGWLLYLGGHIEQAQSYAALAEASMPAEADAGTWAMLRTFQAYLALTQGDHPRAAHLAGEAIDLLGDSRSFFRAAAMGVLGQARRLTGNRAGAIDVLRAAVRLGEGSGNPLSTLEATGYLAPLLYVQGRLREATVLCEDALAGPAVSGEHLLPMAGLVEVPLGTLRYERDELDTARHHLTEGIARCEQLGTTSYTLLGLRTLARLHVASGAYDEAMRALLIARRQADAAEDHRRARLVMATIAELHLRTGNVTAATQALAEISGEEPSTSDYAQLTSARVLLARHKARRALDLLDGIDARAAREGRDGSIIAIRTVTALARNALGDNAAAREALAQAVALAAPDGYRRTFLDEGAALTPLLRTVRDTAPGFVDDLLARATPAPPKRKPERRRRTARLRTVEGVGVVEALTETQHRILELIATGMSNQQVADKLFITVGTTKWHLNQIFGRLQASNRTEAVARARELRLL